MILSTPICDLVSIFVSLCCLSALSISGLLPPTAVPELALLTLNMTKCFCLGAQISVCAQLNAEVCLCVCILVCVYEPGYP